MARYYANNYVESFNESGVTTVVYCKLFGDMVSDTVCIARRQVLTSQKVFSCKGCIMNVALERVCRAQ